MSEIPNVIKGLQILQRYRPEQNRVIPRGSRQLAVWVERHVSGEDLESLTELGWDPEESLENGMQLWTLWVR